MILVRAINTYNGLLNLYSFVLLDFSRIAAKFLNMKYFNTGKMITHELKHNL
jgi:hypothetical protein